LTEEWIELRSLRVWSGDAAWAAGYDEELLGERARQVERERGEAEAEPQESIDKGAAHRLTPSESLTL
jgi:hypothetical protein